MKAIRPPATQPRPIRVAFLSGLQIGGAERCFLQLARHFRAAKAVAWMVPNKGETPLKAEASAMLPVFETGDGEQPPDMVRRAVERTNPNIIVAWGSPNLERLTRGLGLPVVDLCQNSRQWSVMSGSKSEAVKGAHYLAAVSRGSAEAYPEQFAGAATIIPNAADPNRCTPRLTREECRQAWGIQDGEKILAYAARFTTEKNPQSLLRALGALPDEWRLIAAGPPSDERAEFTRRAAAYRPGRVSMIETTDVADLLNVADVWALPSHSEGLPLAMLEAMLAGVPCVVSQWDVYGELAEQFGELAWSVPRNADGHTLAAAIVEAEQAGRFAPRVINARQVVWDNFTSTRVATLWERYLASCLRDWFGVAMFPPLKIVEGFK